MTKYILHGGFTSDDVESNRTFFKEIIKDVPEDGTVLLVCFASRVEDNTDKIKKDINRLREQAGNKKLNFEVATKEDFIEQLKEANAIYIWGGSTEKLMKVLHSYPDLKPLMKGKIIAGSSAGAYALSKLYTSHYYDIALEGLGIVPVRVACHYESSKMPPKPGAVTAIKEASPELELVLLKDHEWKAFEV